MMAMPTTTTLISYPFDMIVFGGRGDLAAVAAFKYRIVISKTP